MVLRATHAPCLDTSLSPTSECTLVRRLYKYVRRGFQLCPLSVLKSLCFYEPPPRTACLCIIVGCAAQTIDATTKSIAAIARNHPNTSSFAVARHKYTERNRCRLEKVTHHAKARHANGDSDVLPLSSGWGAFWEFIEPCTMDQPKPYPTDFVTAWIHMTPCYGNKKGYNFLRDKTNIKGNQLVTEFAQMVDTCGIDNPSNSKIAWSKSHQIVRHKKTMSWLTKTLQASPIHQTYFRPTDYLCGSGSDTDSKSDAGNACGNSETNWNTAGRDDVWVCGRLRRSTRIRMLQNIKNTICRDTGGADMEIWVEDSLTMRHIRLALEDNCTSCTRHPNLTIDGGAHSLTPALETDFATCCL